MKLRLANVDDIKRFYYEEYDEDDKVIEGTRDEETWVELQGQLSKRQANGILRFAPKEGDGNDVGFRFIGKAFDELIVGWSLYDEEGNMIPPTVDVYENLDSGAATWIDRVVTRHLSDALGTKSKNAEKKLDD